MEKYIFAGKLRNGNTVCGKNCAEGIKTAGNTTVAGSDSVIRVSYCKAGGVPAYRLAFIID